MSKKIVVECNPDEALAKCLGLSRKEVVHQPNKGDVCNYLEKYDTNIALVDEDPGAGQPGYMNKFTLAENKHGIKRLVYKNKTILVLQPRLEEWFIGQCSISKISPHPLPASAKDLKKVINLKTDVFSVVIKKLLNNGNEGLVYLKNTIDTICKS